MMLIVMGIGIEVGKSISTRVSRLFHLTILQNVQGDPVQSTSSSICDFTAGGLPNLGKWLSQLCR